MARWRVRQSHPSRCRFRARGPAGRAAACGRCGRAFGTARLRVSLGGPVASAGVHQAGIEKEPEEIVAEIVMGLNLRRLPATSSCAGAGGSCRPRLSGAERKILRFEHAILRTASRTTENQSGEDQSPSIYASPIATSPPNRRARRIGRCGSRWWRAESSGGRRNPIRLDCARQVRASRYAGCESDLRMEEVS